MSTLRADISTAMKLPRRRLVFVDDRAHWLRTEGLLGPALEDRANRVYLYTSPLEALEQIPLRRPQAVVIASRMAHASGAQLARALQRRLGPACPRLALLVEAGERPSEADRALFAEVLVRPVGARTLLELLARADLDRPEPRVARDPLERIAS